MGGYNQNIISSINKILEEHNQQLRILSNDERGITLSNGIILPNGAKKKGFLRHFSISTTASDYLLNNIDELYSTDIDVSTTANKRIRSKASSIGGLSNLNKHGNLRNRCTYTKEVWNKGLTKEDDARIKSPWNKGLTKEDDDRLKQSSITRMGSNNPTHKQSKETRDRVARNNSIIMKNKIASGEFTPNTKNSRTHRSSTVCDQRFRSSWECLFWYFNKQYVYEKVRIPYVGVDSLPHTYIPDFFDESNNTLIEIKPYEHRDSPTNILKFIAAEKYCSDRGWTFNIIDQHIIIGLFERLEEYDYDNFDSGSIKSLRKAYETYIKNRDRQTKRSIESPH